MRFDLTRQHNLVFIVCGFMFFLLMVYAWESQIEVRENIEFDKRMAQEYRNAISNGESEFAAKAYVATLRAERESVKARRAANNAAINSAIATGAAIGSSASHGGS